MLIQLLILTVLLFGVVTAHAQESITIEYGTFDEFDILNRNLAQGPDGTTFAIATIDGSIFLWDWTTRSVIRQLESDYTDIVCQGLTWSQDGSMIAGAFWQNVVIWDTETGEIISEFSRSYSEGYHVSSDCSATTAIAFSYDGDLVATSANDRMQIIVWNLVLGYEVNRTEVSDSIVGFYGYEFARNSHWLVALRGSSRARAVTLWSMVSETTYSRPTISAFSFTLIAS